MLMRHDQGIILFVVAKIYTQSVLFDPLAASDSARPDYNILYFSSEPPSYHVSLTHWFAPRDKLSPAEGRIQNTTAHHNLIHPDTFYPATTEDHQPQIDGYRCVSRERQ